MSNVLLVDTNFSSGPIYQFLIQSGHNVTVLGGNPNDALAKSVYKYIQFDYSDIENTRKIITDHQIDFLVPGCNDRSYMVCAEINHDGRFPGFDPLETAEIINNKKKFRTFASLHHLPIPKMLSAQEIGTRWPVIVKPVDAFSGRGVSLVRENQSHDLATAIKLAREASSTETYIVEDYVEGQLYSHTAFIQSGKIVADHIVEEHGTVNPFVVDTSRVIYDFPLDILEGIRKDVYALATHLKLHSGLIHTQFIRNRDQYWLIEVTRRCPGDLYSQLIEISTGMNYVENYIRPFLGLDLDIKSEHQKKCIMRHTLTLPYEHTLGSVSFTLPLLIRKWVPISQSGDRLRASPYGRVGILFTECSNEMHFQQIWQATLLRNLYNIHD